MRLGFASLGPFFLCVKFPNSFLSFHCIFVVGTLPFSHPKLPLSNEIINHSLIKRAPVESKAATKCPSNFTISVIIGDFIILRSAHTLAGLSFIDAGSL
ncbi:hypothetical protein BDW62DRAFT_129513 [Aspergillus aurantiobrunneus]